MRSRRPGLPQSLVATVMSSWRVAIATMFAAGSLYGIAPAAAEQAPTGAGQPPTQESEAPQPQASPEGTVGELYADESFFHARNALPAPMLQRFSRCFTPELVSYIESRNEEVDRWLEAHKNETLKLPMSEGPIFLSNYEGADTFSIGRADVDGTHAKVPVSFSYTEGGDTVRWVDIVLLRLVDGVWLMDDIRFDRERWDDYTLRQRLSLDE